MCYIGALALTVESGMPGIIKHALLMLQDLQCDARNHAGQRKWLHTRETILNGSFPPVLLFAYLFTRLSRTAAEHQGVASELLRLNVWSP